MAGIGYVVISKDITLDFVPLVPNLHCNLLSISKLTREKNYVINFFPKSLCFSEFEFEEDDWQC